MALGLRTAEMGRPSHTAASDSERSGSQLGEFLLQVVAASFAVCMLYTRCYETLQQKMRSFHVGIVSMTSKMRWMIIMCKLMLLAMMTIISIVVVFVAHVYSLQSFAAAAVAACWR